MIFFQKQPRQNTADQFKNKMEVLLSVWLLHLSYLALVRPCWSRLDGSDPTPTPLNIPPCPLYIHWANQQSPLTCVKASNNDCAL